MWRQPGERLIAERGTSALSLCCLPLRTGCALTGCALAGVLPRTGEARARRLVATAERALFCRDWACARRRAVCRCGFAASAVGESARGGRPAVERTGRDRPNEAVLPRVGGLERAMSLLVLVAVVLRLRFRWHGAQVVRE